MREYQMKKSQKESFFFFAECHGDWQTSRFLALSCRRIESNLPKKSWTHNGGFCQKGSMETHLYLNTGTHDSPCTSCPLLLWSFSSVSRSSRSFAHWVDHASRDRHSTEEHHFPSGKCSPPQCRSGWSTHRRSAWRKLFFRAPVPERTLTLFRQDCTYQRISCVGSHQPSRSTKDVLDANIGFIDWFDSTKQLCDRIFLKGELKFLLAFRDARKRISEKHHTSSCLHKIALGLVPSTTLHSSLSLVLSLSLVIF